MPRPLAGTTLVLQWELLNVRYGSLADIGEKYQVCPLYAPEADILNVEIDVR